ncbi:MAG TPA: hypothetical protein VHR55_09875 [Candidatus Limnocylindria bacterium]|nr:hypothetical protein [Candidatus Limnocylindria bacterium]
MRPGAEGTERGGERRAFSRDWLSWPLHHVLIAAYPILYLVSINVGEVDVREALIPLGVSIGAALALFAVLVLVGVAARRAALVVSIVAVGVLMYGHVATALEPTGLSGTPLLVGWIVLALVGIGAVALWRSDLRRVTGWLNVGSGLLVAFTLVGVGATLVTNPPTIVGGQGIDLPSPTAGSGDPSAPQRDIYYFILDGYGSPRSLEQYLDVPDGGLTDWLESAGFDVLRETRSNYARTPLSLSSSLNMTYLDEVAERYGPDNPHHGPLEEMVKTNAVAQFLRERGYRYVLLGNQYYLTARSPIADVNPQFAQTSDFMGVLTESTILPSVARLAGFEDDLTDRRRIYDAAVWQHETLPELSELPGPKFVFMHSFLPHEPWIVDENGQYVSAEADAERTPLEQHRAQWAYVDREMRRLIEGLLAGPPETDPIIIISPDHGPRPEGIRQVGPNIDWTAATDAHLDQAFSIFSAYYLPGIEDTSCLYDGMSSVNSFRLVFDLYFDAGLPLLPDRSVIHRDREHPYDLTDITDRLPELGRGSDTETECHP